MLSAVLLMCALGLAGAAGADTAKGTLTHKGTTVALKYAYLVTGPDVVDSKMMVRSLVLSQNDIGARIRECKVSSCVAGAVTEGMTLDFISGPRLGFWVAVRNAHSQHSGTLEPSAFKKTVDQPGRIAGTLIFDKTAFGGPRVDAEFDATLIKEFKAMH